MSEEFEGILRPNLAPERAEQAESLWERFALAALHAVQADEPEAAAEIAAIVADEMLLAWDDRFNAQSVLCEQMHAPIEEPDPDGADVRQIDSRTPAHRPGRHEGRGRGRR